MLQNMSELSKLHHVDTARNLSKCFLCFLSFLCLCPCLQRCPASCMNLYMCANVNGKKLLCDPPTCFHVPLNFPRVSFVQYAIFTCLNQLFCATHWLIASFLCEFVLIRRRRGGRTTAVAGVTRPQRGSVSVTWEYLYCDVITNLTSYWCISIFLTSFAVQRVLFMTFCDILWNLTCDWWIFVGRVDWRFRAFPSTIQPIRRLSTHFFSLLPSREKRSQFLWKIPDNLCWFKLTELAPCEGQQFWLKK